MRHWKVKNKETQEETFAITEDDQTPASAGYSSATYSWSEVAEPTEADTIKTAVQFDMGEAQAWARAELDRKVRELVEATVPDIRLRDVLFETWAEVQRLKLAFRIPGAVPVDEEMRKREYPRIMALSILSGTPPLTIVDILEQRYWPRVRDIALADAKLLLAHDAVAAATTPAAMVDVASNWSA
jgi:hypothetical protein